MGNHEFDHGVEGIVPFLEHIHAKVIVANIDDEDEPTIQGKYEKTLVIDRYGRKIGIIGIIISNVDVRILSSLLKMYMSKFVVSNLM